MTTLRIHQKQIEEKLANPHRGYYQLLLGKGGACSSLAKAKKKPNVKPPKAHALRMRPNNKRTEFRRFYDRGDLPLQVNSF